MGKSQETFSKKEKEKKKQQKKKEKLLKKQERKENNSKGKSFEDMLAYVDENGVITSTPPDPKKKKSFKAEDIQIGVSKQTDNPEDLLRVGTVTHYNDAKGYGFIRDHQSNDSVFVHANELDQPIKEGDKVTFETERSQKGLNAIRVKVSS
ncbi:MAG: cold-shock protein [Bacteroidia bacterium]